MWRKRTERDMCLCHRLCMCIRRRGRKRGLRYLESAKSGLRVKASLQDGMEGERGGAPLREWWVGRDRRGESDVDGGWGGLGLG